MRFLLDTNIVSAPVAKKPNAEVVARLEARSRHCAVPAPVWHELNFGCQRLPAGKRRRALLSYLTRVVKVAFPILPYDEAAAGWHAMERARLEKLGRPAPYVDGQIAAIASTAGLILVTQNTRDFEGYSDLEVVDWSR